tara:strand:+ start:241 stop:807 length:567 start_codon:yes stop_codon:yes gene_type:complete
MKGKIFCIGLNKMGTTSLHSAFLKLGIRSVHFSVDGTRLKQTIHNNYVKKFPILKGVDGYEAYSDWDLKDRFQVIKELDKQFPGSKFVLQCRDLKPWLKSREKHIKRNQEKCLADPDDCNRWLNIDKPKWVETYKTHYPAVRKYFKGRDDLLEFNLFEGDGWDKLCRFLKRPVPNVSFPLENTAESNQ